MAYRRLLTDEERQALLGIPLDADSMARCFTLSRADRHLAAARRRDANRIGFAVQLALLRYRGIALALLEQPVEPLVSGWQGSSRSLLPHSPDMRVARRP
jgi:TnpA family transposase